jgi:hypothetical protein
MTPGRKLTTKVVAIDCFFVLARGMGTVGGHFLRKLLCAYGFEVAGAGPILIRLRNVL